MSAGGGNPHQSINPFENYAPSSGGPPQQAGAPAPMAPPAAGFGWGAALGSAWAPAQPVPTQEPDSPPAPRHAGPNYTLEPREAAPIWSGNQAAQPMPMASGPGGPGGYGGPPPGPAAWGSSAVPPPETSAPSTFHLLQPGAQSSDAAVPAAGAAAAGGAAAGSKLGWFKGFGASNKQGAPGGPPDPPVSDTRPLLVDNQGRPAPAAAPANEDYSKYAFYNVRRYRPYFNVDTKEVGWRVLSSFIGVFKADFIEVTLERPDLYGPFWIATTLIFVTAAANNLHSWVNFNKAMNTSPPPPPPNATAVPTPDAGEQIFNQQWFADPTKLGTSAAIFYGYVFIVSILLWLWIKYMRGDIRLVNVFCMYGYAMTIFIPVSALCVIPNGIVQWVLIMVATAISGGFLVRNLRSATDQVALIKTMWLLGVVFAVHVGMGLALKLYFFKY